MQYFITLQPGQWVRQNAIGRTLILLDAGAAASVDMRVEVVGFSQEEISGVKRGFKMRTPGFTGISLRAAVLTTVNLVTSDADVDINQTDGAAVVATIAGTPSVQINAGQLPLPVSNDRGAPGAPVYVSGITYSDAPATALNDLAAVNVTATLTAAVAANANRRGLRFTNNGVEPIAIGGAALTWAKRAIVLAAGDTWVEERAANLAWSAICDAGKTSTLNIQEVIA